VITPSQSELFGEDLQHGSILRAAIQDRPSAELRQGYTWHIGNVETIGERDLYFALGRTTRSSVERFDEERGNFVIEEFETAPYTHVLADMENQVFALAAKTRLAPSVPGIARQLEKLLGTSNTMTRLRATIEVSELKDPEDFLAHIRSAYAVEKFDFSFSRPNPWDVNEDFVQPLERYLEAVDGLGGTASVRGTDLNRQTIEDVARSAAASGDSASAKIRRNEEDRPVSMSLEGNPVVIHEEEVETADQKRSLLDRIKSLYRRVRHSEERASQ
jgi:hypothetical protein